MMMCISVLRGQDSPGFILTAPRVGKLPSTSTWRQNVLNGPLLLCLMDSGDVHDSLCYCSICEVEA